MPFLDHPILRKELLTRLRSGKTFVALGFWIAASASAMGWGWSVGADYWPDAPGPVRTQQLVRMVFYFGTIGQVVLAAVLAPAWVVGAFSVERGRGTLDMLLTTPVSLLSMALAKFASCTGTLMLLVLLSVPAYSMLLLLGGVTGTELALSVAVVLAAIAVFSAVGLFASAWCRTPAGAAMASAAIVGALWLLMSGSDIMWLWDDPLRLTGRACARWNASPNYISWLNTTACISPFSAVVLIGNSGGRIADLGSVTTGLAIQGLGALALVALASVGIRRRWTPLQHQIDGLQALRERRVSPPFSSPGPLRRWPSLPDHANPVFAKDLRTMESAGAHWWATAFCVSAMCHLLLVTAPLTLASLPDASGISSTHGTVACVECLFMMLLTLVAVPGIAAEREGATLDDLRTSPISDRRVLWGKMLTAVTYGSPFLAGALVSWAAVAAFGHIAWTGFFIVAFGICGAFAAAVALCTLVSVLSPRTSTAFAVAVALMVPASFLVFGPALTASLRYAQRVASAWPRLLGAASLLLGYGTVTALLCEAATLAYRRCGRG